LGANNRKGFARMTFNEKSSLLEGKEKNKKVLSRNGLRFGLITVITSFFVFLLGARPSLFGLDRSPVIGFIQIAVLLVGLAGMCVGGYICIKTIWRGKQLSIAADIGMRLVATGFVVTVFSGMADVFGVGSHPLPSVPYFGGWQSRGVEIGEIIIAFGFLLMIPFKSKNKSEKVEALDGKVKID